MQDGPSKKTIPKSSSCTHLLFRSNDCSVPVCSTPCGRHGNCTAPNTCTCETGWQGANVTSARTQSFPWLNLTSSSLLLHSARRQSALLRVVLTEFAILLLLPACVTQDSLLLLHATKRLPNVPETQLVREEAITGGNPVVTQLVGNLCSGTSHGTCDITTKICTCTSEWAGAVCSVPVCNGISDVTTVCSGHGVCNATTSPHQCNCDAGWSGIDCSQPSCPNGCSGNGMCSVATGE